MTKAEANAEYEAALENYRAASRVERAAQAQDVAAWVAAPAKLDAASKALNDAEEVLIAFADASSYGEP